jgi:uncharacterized protein (UPF0261 family)
MLDSPGGPFWDPDADRACYDAIRSGLKPGISVIEIDTNINDPIFADRATRVFLELSGASGAMAFGTHGSQGNLI